MDNKGENYFNRKDFRRYIKNRHISCEYYYRLIHENKRSPLVKEMYKMHLANNIRFIDVKSQNLIKAVNYSKSTTIDDKLLTALLYTEISDKWVLNNFSNFYKVIDIKRAEEIVSYYSQDKSLRHSFIPHNISSFERRDYGGSELARKIESFFISLPADRFYSWSMSDIFNYYIRNSHYGFYNQELFQLVHNIFYIDELDIKYSSIISANLVTATKFMRSWGVDSFQPYILDKLFEVEYPLYLSSVDFHSDILKMCVPTDLIQMMSQYFHYRGRDREYDTTRNYTQVSASERKVTMPKISSILIPKGVMTYHEKHNLCSEAN